ncbi:hypothetical protein ABMA28_016372 [Loxostege sticticalis]|uniref:Reverse transcriptase domain-containing protein n=1 Tax=Loxostege sticticalis TaxID=481309 RepID=A0ABD0T8N6_LOXSC
MQATRQRLGDQRRAIVQKKLLPQNTIDNIYIEVQRELNSTPSSNPHQSISQTLLPQSTITPATQPSQRMKWTEEYNEAIMRSYFRVTNLETDITAYRSKVHQEFIDRFPHLSHITEQRVADQRRLIIINKWITSEKLNIIRREVAEELRLAKPNEEATHQQLEYLSHPINTTLNDTQELNSSMTTQTPLISFASNTCNDDDNEPHNDERNLSTNTFTSKFCQEIEIEFDKAFELFKNTNPTERPYLPKQKTSKKLNFIVEHLNKNIVPKHISTDQNFINLQTVIYCAAYTAAVCNGSLKSNNSNHTHKKPHWQIRLENKINMLRSEIGRLTQFIKGNRNPRVVTAVDNIKIKYKQHSQYDAINVDLTQFLDTLKQKLSATASRLKRYLTCTKRKSQNKLFINNEKLFYRNLEQPKSTHDTRSPETPTSQSLYEFWAAIWENPVSHSSDTEWLQNFNSTQIPTMNFEHISVDTFIKVINRTHNWKAPGTDKIHNYWYKKLTCTYPYIHNHINQFIQSPDTLPDFLTQGITYMLPKDKDTVNPAKYRPITCLQTIYKIITACLSEIIYSHLEEYNILAEEQKGSRKHSQGCKEQLIIDAIATKQAHTNKQNIHSMYIDYQKAFDSVPHSWLLSVLEIYKIHPVIISFLKNTMVNWQTVLSIKNAALTTDPIKIQRGIFQGDSLSPLWFCLALNPLSKLLNESNRGFKLKHNNSHINLSHLLYMDDIKLFASNINELYELAEITENFSRDIKMNFGVDKCKILSVNKGKIELHRYTLQNNEIIDALEENNTYKYLGFHQAKQINQKQTKTDLITKFHRRLDLIFRSELNSKNTVKAVNTFAIPVLTYSFGIVHWSQTDLKKLQRSVHTKLTKNRKHHPKSCVQRLTLPRQEGGRGFIDIQNLHNKQISTLRKFFHTKSQISLLHKFTIIEKEHKINTWKEKSLHGRHKADLDQDHIDKDASNKWLQRGELFPETEAFMLAIQDQVIATRNYRKYIIREPNLPTDLCRQCCSASETIQHITSACKALANTDYKHRHDQIAAIIHQNLAYQYHFVENKTPYYKYKPTPVLDNKKHKIYWDRTIITDRTTHYNRPDITLHDKDQNIVYLIDIAVPNTHNILSTINEKLSKYTDLAIQIKIQWKG